MSGSETAVSLGIHVQRLTLVNMLLCCLVVGAALSLTCVAWWMVHCPEQLCF